LLHVVPPSAVLRTEEQPADVVAHPPLPNRVMEVRDSVWPGGTMVGWAAVAAGPVGVVERPGGGGVGAEPVDAAVSEPVAPGGLVF
jgi:hypothetical protein